MILQIIPTLASVLAISTASSGAQAPSKARLDAIWDAVDDRMARQIDVWFDEGDFPKAINGLTIESYYYPHDYDVVTNLGWMHENVEDWEKALQTYATYRKSNPQDKDAALPEGQYYLMRKQYAKVPPLLEPTLSLHPHPNVYRILARAYERMNKFSDAVRVWKQFLAVYPDDGQGKVNLARDQKKAAESQSH